MVSMNKVERIVRSVVEQEFENVEVSSIDITRDLDEYGENILLVKVVFDGDRRALDARKTSSLARHILPKIGEIGEDAFPVFSFIAKSELGKVNPDRA